MPIFKMRLGSGKVTSVVREHKEHVCHKPHSTLVAQYKLGCGSKWKCDCGKTYILATKPVGSRGVPTYVWKETMER